MAAAAAEAAAGQLDAAALRRLWPEVLEIVKQSSRRTRALLDNAQIVGATGDVVSLSASPALSKMIAEESNTEILKAALTRVVGGTWRIQVGASDTAARGSAPGDDGSPAAVATGPLPPEPDPRDDPDFDAAPGERGPVIDPEVEALKLLQNELGARPVES